MLSINDLINMTGLKRATFSYHIKKGNLIAEKFGANSWAVSEKEWERFCKTRDYEDGRYKQF